MGTMGGNRDVRGLYSGSGNVGLGGWGEADVDR